MNSVYVSQMKSYDFLKISDCSIYVASDESKWVASQRQKQGQRKKLTAGELKFGTHFTSHNFQICDEFQEKFTSFLDSIISTPRPNMIQPNGFGLQCQLHRISSDILEAASMVKSVVESKLAPNVVSRNLPC